jgi:hypothetical protein
MSREFTYKRTKPMTEEEIAIMHRYEAKRALRNMLIVLGIKWAIIIGINRWARSLDEKN